MKRQVFYSFHYSNDCWRTQIVRNIGAIEGNTPVNVSAWEEVKRKGSTAIENWINSNMRYRSCAIVLVGSETASRPWVQYDIESAWKTGKGIVCIDIHFLKNQYGETCSQGENPLSKFFVDKTYNFIAKRENAVDSNEIRLSNICKFYHPSASNTYNDIANNIESLVEDAINIRKQYP